MKLPVSLIFKQKPDQWGLRSDAYLWEELQQAFSKVYLPFSKSCFIHHFEQYFYELTRHQLNMKSPIWIKKYAHGRMPNGNISVEFWQKTALPLLINRLKKEIKKIASH